MTGSTPESAGFQSCLWQATAASTGDNCIDANFAADAEAKTGVRDRNYIDDPVQASATFPFESWLRSKATGPVVKLRRILAQISATRTRGRLTAGTKWVWPASQFAACGRCCRAKGADLPTRQRTLLNSQAWPAYFSVSLGVCVLQKVVESHDLAQL